MVVYYNFDVFYYNNIGKSFRYLYKILCCGIFYLKQ